jgi:hypothetical protein
MLAMSNLRTSKRIFAAFVIAAATLVAMAAQPPKPPAEPAKIAISVEPESVSPGGRAEATLTLAPIEGVVINRYPKITLKVAETEGLVHAAEVAVGNDAPPPPDDKSGSNYFDEVDPVRLTLSFDEAVKSGAHEIDGKLKYYYCVKKSGFCAPKRMTVKIPVRIR